MKKTIDLWTADQLPEFRVVDLVETIKLLHNATDQQHKAIRAVMIRELKSRSKADLVRYILKTIS